MTGSDRNPKRDEYGSGNIARWSRSAWNWIGARTIWRVSWSSGFKIGGSRSSKAWLQVLFIWVHGDSIVEKVNRCGIPKITWPQGSMRVGKREKGGKSENGHNTKRNFDPKWPPPILCQDSLNWKTWSNLSKIKRFGQRFFNWTLLDKRRFT